jgi:hypothetical protein
MPGSHGLASQAVQMQSVSPLYLRAFEEHSAVLRGLSGNSQIEDQETFAFGGLQDHHALQLQLSTGSSNCDGALHE